MHDAFAPLPEPPYVAVIFTTRRTPGDHGYAAEAARMDARATRQPGYLGMETARDADGFGITVSYWASDDHARAWKADAEHALARQRGRADWYERYSLRVATVTRQHGWTRGDPPDRR